jgi:hypothetical protein
LSIGLLVLAFSTGGRSSEENPGLLSNWEWELTSETLSETLEAEVGGLQIVMETELAPEEVPAAPPSIVVPTGPLYDIIATHYGVAYNGRTLGCGTGYYTSDNISILAVGPSRNSEWPCGTLLQICGPLACNLVTRHDACPGCSRNVVDLSEAGLDLLCGYQTSTCRVTIQKIMLVDPEPEPPPVPEAQGGSDDSPGSEDPTPEVEQDARPS